MDLCDKESVGGIGWSSAGKYGGGSDNDDKVSKDNGKLLKIYVF